jgi:predicted peroxiredoxin
MRKLFIAALLLPAVVILILGWSNNSGENNKVLIHIVTDIKKDDGPPCVAVDVALTNLQLGKEVVVLFDANASWNLKKADDGKNDYDRYEVPADLKKLVNEQLNVKELSSLKNFGEFLEMLHKKGAKIAVNGTWNVLTSVEKEVKGKTKMPDYVEPLTLKELVKEINSAGTYYSY